MNINKLFGQMITWSLLWSLFEKFVVRYAHQSTHRNEQFIANVQDLLGEHPAHDILSHLCQEEMGSGKGTWIDGNDAKSSDDADRGLLSAKDTRMEFYQRDAGDQTFANYLLTKTPGMDITKIRTWSAPQLIEWGHYFDEDEEWEHLVDPKGKEVNIGVRKIFLGRDEAFAEAVTASTVQRKTSGNDTLHTVSMPASQTLDDLTYATVDVDNLPSMICEKFDDVYFAKGMPIYCAISAKTARHFRSNSRDKIHSNDFVRSYDNFRKGSIPEIDGVTFIVMPTSFMTAYASGDAIDTYFAWVPNGMTKINYNAMKVSIDVDPSHRFDCVAYAREKPDWKRTDDLGVVLGDVLAG